MIGTRTVSRLGVIGVYLLCIWPTCAAGALIQIDAPALGQWVNDRGGVVRSEAEHAIAAECEAAFTESGVPIFVVVINSISLYAREGTTIETLARSTFDAWGRDTGFPYRSVWRKGMLLLVSLKDRKARIELGAEWARTADEQCERIMQEFIVREFRQGNYTEGIAAGVDGLAHVAKGENFSLSRRWLWLGVLDGVILTPQFFMIVGFVVFCFLFPGFVFGGSGGSSSQRDTWDVYDAGGGSGGGSDYGGGGGATGSW